MGSSGEAFSQETWDWAVEQLPKLAATYRDIDRAELEAELAATLLELRRKPNPGVRNWKGYLTSCLRHRASFLVRRWRDERSRETSSEEYPLVEPGVPDAAGLTTEAVHAVSVQTHLGNADRHFLKQLAEAGWNISRLARRLGQHRNTLHRRLRRIRDCPIAIESAPGLVHQTTRATLEAIIRDDSAKPRATRRAQLLLAILDGLTYEEIVHHLGTSAATIARWRTRFAERGVEGLNPHHPRRKPSAAHLRLRQWLRRHKTSQLPSVRALARQFGLGKSSVDRIVRSKR